jgi:hypothetical protein
LPWTFPIKELGWLEYFLALRLCTLLMVSHSTQLCS